MIKLNIPRVSLKARHNYLILTPKKLESRLRVISPTVFISIFSISWAMLAVSISFFSLEFTGWHVFDFRSSHIYFQGHYSLYFFPFVCSIFLVIVFALVDFVFNAFLAIILLQPLPGVESNSLSDYWRVRLLSLEPRLSFIVLPVPLYLSGCNSQA